MKPFNMKSQYICIALMLIHKISIAQKDQIERVWYNEEKTSKIQLYKAMDGKFYGTITWLKNPADKDGKPRLDKQNPDAKLKSRTILNSIILKSFRKSSDDVNLYVDGTVYDPNNGKNYCGKLTFKGKELKLRGYICNFSLLGRTTVWTLAE